MSVFGRGTASFKGALPYWQVLDTALPSRATAALVLLKDGSICMGLGTDGQDISAASYTQIDQQGFGLAEALRHLPSDAFVQADFRNGLDFEPLIKRFAAQECKDAHPLLRRGRAEQSRMFASREDLSRRALTYWVGCNAFKGPGGWRKALSNPKTRNDVLRDAGDTLFRCADKFRDDLQLAGVKTDYLSAAQALDAFHQAVNPNTWVEQAIEGTRFVETEADLERWRHGAPWVLPGFSVSSQLPLSGMQVEDTFLTMGEPPMLGRILTAVRLGPSTDMEALHALMYQGPQQPFRISVTHQPTDRQLRREALVRGRRRIMGLGMRVVSDSAAAQVAMQESQELCDRLEMGDVSVFDTSITVLVTGRDHFELDEQTRLVVEALGGQGIAATTMVDAQMRGWLATLPANGSAACGLPNRLTATDLGAAHLLPHYMPSAGDAQPDILLTNRLHGLEGLTVRVGAGREHAGAIIVGGIGSGKTFLFLHLVKYGILSVGGHAVLIDKKGAANSSLKPQCDEMGGAFFAVAGCENISFNIFPLRSEALDENGKVRVGRRDRGGKETLDVLNSVTTLLLMMAYPDDHGRAIAKEKVARDAIQATYDATVDKSGPILADAVQACGELIFKDDPNRDELLQVAAEMKKNLAWHWLEDARRASLFNRPGHVDLSNRLTLYDFFGCEQDRHVEDVMVASLALRVAAKMEGLGRTVPKMFGADEYWSSSPGVTKMVHRLSRLQRSFGFCVLLLTQRYEDIAKGEYGDGVLGATSMLYLLQHMDGHDALAEQLNLNDRARELFRSLRTQVGRYSEALLVEREGGGSGSARVIRCEPSPLDYWWGTSRPADVKLRDAWLARHDGNFSQAIAALAQRFPEGAPTTSLEPT